MRQYQWQCRGLPRARLGLAYWPLGLGQIGEISLRFAVDYRIMKTVVSEMSRFPVRLMSFLHTPFKIKCKYAVFTAIVTKDRRPDAIRNGQCKQIDTGSKHYLFWVAHARGNLFAQNNDKARELGILSYFDIYDQCNPVSSRQQRAIL